MLMTEERMNAAAAVMNQSRETLLERGPEWGVGRSWGEEERWRWGGGWVRELGRERGDLFRFFSRFDRIFSG